MLTLRSAAVLVEAKGFGDILKKGFGSKQATAKGCPCGSGNPYESCCKVRDRKRLIWGLILLTDRASLLPQPYHDGAALPPTPEALMRSRYTAYVKNLPQYIVDTTSPENPSFNGSVSEDGKIRTTLLQDAMATCRTCSFERLQVLSAEDGSGPDEGFVTFKATFSIVGQKGQRQGGECPGPSEMRCVAQVPSPPPTVVTPACSSAGMGGKSQVLSERSKFARVDGKWLYVDGDHDWEAHRYEKKTSDA